MALSVAVGWDICAVLATILHKNGKTQHEYLDFKVNYKSWKQDYRKQTNTKIIVLSVQMDSLQEYKIVK